MQWTPDTGRNEGHDTLWHRSPRPPQTRSARGQQTAEIKSATPKTLAVQKTNKSARQQRNYGDLGGLSIIFNHN